MMNFLRISNLYLVARNLHPEYITFLSCYGVEKGPLSYTRIFNKRESYSTNKQCSGYNVRRMIHESPKLDYAIKMPKTPKDKLPDIKFSMDFLKNVRMDDLAKAPGPIFWYSAVCLLPLIGPPLSFMLFGYSSALATMQLVFGATLCSFLGGIKWGYAMSDGDKHKPTWENLGWAIIPQVIGWMALLMPQIIGFLMSAGGIYLATYIDLTATNYPAWFRSVRVMVGIPALIGLLISFIIRIFH